MTRLQSANFAVTTLAVQILNSAVSPLSFEVSDASLFPDLAAGEAFIILIHDNTSGFGGVKEIMEVGAINKGTGILSAVTRAREGTVAQTHAIGARVECVWTAGTHGELADSADLETHRLETVQDSVHGLRAIDVAITWPGDYTERTFPIARPVFPWGQGVKLTNPADLPAGTGNGCAWSPNGEFLSVAHASTPFITNYQTPNGMPEYGVMRILGLKREGT